MFSLGHLSIFGKTLTQYANGIESTNLPTNFHHQLEVQQELPKSDAEFNPMRNYDITDLRPTSQLTKINPKVTWEKFILDTYPNHKISEKWEELIQGFFKPKNTLTEWEKAWRRLFDEKESSEDLVIKDTLYNMLSPNIEAFKAPFNILKSGDLEENQYNSQFVNPILKNTLNAICSMDWRILEVPIRSSKYRRNSNIDPFIDKTGGPDVDDVTDFYVQDYKLGRTMRDVLNQRIILRLNDSIKDCDNLASFGALGHRDEVSLFWCMIHQRSYCLRSFRIPTIWQDLPVLSEAVITCLKFFVSATKYDSTSLYIVPCY
uniref:Uncharacterized protein n=1 Tax=Rhizophagus irregularis (strain DAOM 181602 / DAOM 197198 / MUCL 43194) TaxID=747089 RepID=U9UP10_RHIID